MPGSLKCLDGCKCGHHKKKLERKAVIGDNRICPMCSLEKPLSNFPLKGKYRDGDSRYSYCKPCHSKYQRIQTMKSKFGLSIQDYDAIVAHQGGACAICKRPPKDGGNRLSVDHEHSSGMIRGALCWLCNKALGFIKDRPERLNAMIEYINNPPAILALGGVIYGKKGRVDNKAKKKKK